MACPPRSSATLDPTRVVSTNPKEIDRVVVFRREIPIGHLERTPHGASFEYNAAVLEAGDSELAVASTMPIRREPYAVRGVNLHPFFAGLLPEGLRHTALVKSVKTSADDLFSLLLGAGQETVGDVWVAEPIATSRPMEVNLESGEELDFAELLDLALGIEETLDSKSIPGVQPKVSDAMISLGVRGSTKMRDSILKLAPPSDPQLVENEAFCMQLARTARLEVAPTRVLHDVAGRSALLVERFDRNPQTPYRPPLRERAAGFRHQEDACQLLDVYPADKYRLSMREIADALEVCWSPLYERLRLLQLYAFSYAIANGDLHGKNISVLWSERRVALSPAYDLVTTLPYGDDSMALKVEGRDKRVKRADLVAFGERVGVRAKATETMLDKLVAKLGPALGTFGAIGLDDKRTAHLEQVVKERLAHLARD